MGKLNADETEIQDKWLHNKNTIEFLGIWEEMYNADFNAAAYEEIMLEAGLNRFIMSVKQ